MASSEHTVTDQMELDEQTKAKLTLYNLLTTTPFEEEKFKTTLMQARLSCDDRHQVFQVDQIFSPKSFVYTSLLHTAVDLRHESIVALLLELGANPDIALPPQSGYAAGITPIYYAAFNGDDAIISLLLKYNANPNTPRPDTAAQCSGETALHRAAMLGHESTVSLLLLNGARADVACSKHAGQFTPLHYAVKGLVTIDKNNVVYVVNKQIVTKLLQHGANPHAALSHAPNYDGKLGLTPLDIARSRKNNEEIVALLLSFSAACYSPPAPVSRDYRSVFFQPGTPSEIMKSAIIETLQSLFSTALTATIKDVKEKNSSSQRRMVTHNIPKYNRAITACYDDLINQLDSQLLGKLYESHADEKTFLAYLLNPDGKGLLTALAKHVISQTVPFASYKEFQPSIDQFCHEVLDKDNYEPKKP